jgi:uncharacterized protein YggT (Ycf19 family)
MGLINLILNLAGLLLWLNWRSIRFDPFSQTTPATLAGTLRRAAPSRIKRWHFLAALGALLLLRGLVYWQIGAAVDWTPHLHLDVMERAIPFRSDDAGLMLLFSGLSFGITLGLFYLCLLLLSLVNDRGTAADPLQKIVRLQLGRIDRWPWPVRALLPLLVTGLCWYLLSLLFVRLRLTLPLGSNSHRLEQALVVGLGAYLNWRFLIGGLLALHLVSTYIYLGNQPFWSFIAATGRNLLTPLRPVPLHLGKVDFAPLVGMALVFLFAELAERALALLHSHLPL